MKPRKIFEVIECQDCRFFLTNKKWCNFHEIYTSPIAFCSLGEDLHCNYCKEIKEETPIENECKDCTVIF